MMPKDQSMILWPDLAVAVGFSVNPESSKVPISIVKRLIAEDIFCILTGKRSIAFFDSTWKGTPELIDSLKKLGISDLKVNVISEDEVIKRLK